MTTESPEDKDPKVRPLYDELAEQEDFSRSSRFKRGQQKTLSGWVIRLWPLWIGIAAIVMLVWGVNYHAATLNPTAVVQKMEAVAALRVNLLKSVESEKRAVMADTDEASMAYAEESRQASDAVEAERVRLTELNRLYPAEDERKLLNEFDDIWAQMRTLDQQILALAVQNTNLKAMALSFGDAASALHRFQSAMESLAHDTDNLIIVRLASDALIAALTIQTLHAPHIASPDDAVMGRIENIMSEQEAIVRRCQVTELSRQNTNVKSFEISLNRKQKMTSQCETILSKLQDAIKGREYKATR